MCSDGPLFLNGASGLNIRKNIKLESEFSEEIIKFNERGKIFDMLYIVISDKKPV